MASWRLEDVEARQREKPRDFPIPRREERAQLQAGDLVKLVFLIDRASGAGLDPPGELDGERMWVEVESVDGAKLRGRLRNQPRAIAELREGDGVEFEARHVAALLEPPVDAAATAIVSRRVLDEAAWPARLVREPAREGYSGWQVLAGDEPVDYFRTTENARVIAVGELLDFLPVLESVFAVDEPSEWRWDEAALEFVRAR